jgi:hypothetical protein
VLVVVVVSTAPNVATGTDWTNCTFTLSANGQTLQCSTPDGTSTFTSGGGSTPGGNTPNISAFAGTWNASGGRSCTFTGNNFTYTVNGTTLYSGTFSVSGSTITFTISLGIASGNFTLSATTLVLSNHTWDNSVNGTYTKDTSGGTTPGGNTPSGEGGTFTLTDIPSTYNGKYIEFYAVTRNAELMGCIDFNQITSSGNPITTLVQIRNGRADFPMWQVTESTPTPVRYYGNDTVTSGEALIYDSNDPDNVYEDAIVGIRFRSGITFTNGSATKSWSEGTVFTPQK